MIRDSNTINEIYFGAHCVERDDPLLVQTVEELGDKSSMRHPGSLKVVEIPDDVKWWIDEDDCGTEIIREKARSWR